MTFLAIMHQTPVVETLGFIAMAVGILSFVSRKQNNTRSILGVSAMFWAAHYYLLSAYTTAGTQLVLVFRNFLSIFIKKESTKHVVFWIAVSLITGLCAMTWQGWKSIIPLLAGLNSTYALCYLDNKKMREMMVVTSILWMANGVIWASWAQVAAEMIKISINMFFSKKITGDINAEDKTAEDDILEINPVVIKNEIRN